MIELTVEEVNTLNKARDVLEGKLINHQPIIVKQAIDGIRCVLVNSTLTLGTTP